jgi:hypothetical protein
MAKHAPNYKPVKITAADKKKKANQKKKMSSMSLAGKLGKPVMRVPLDLKTGKPKRSNFNTKIKM